MNHGTSTPPLLAARGLTKTYFRSNRLFGRRREVPALRGVDLELHAGETVALVGASGSGKSTLARLLAGLDQPTSGELWLDGEKRSNGAAWHRRIQLIFQDPGASLNPHFSVAQALAEPLRILHRAVARRDELVERLRQVGLPETALDLATSQLSGGQKARLALARALAALDDPAAPAVLILDESLASLDLSVQAQIINLLVDLQQTWRLAYLLVAHDLRLAAHMAGQVAVMLDGQIVESGAPSRVFTAPHHPHTAFLLAATPAWKGSC